jgi:hypothetical protein
VTTGDEAGLLIGLPSGAALLKIQLFTTAYRKVSETVMKDVPAGRRQVKLSLLDPKGRALAKGFYHLLVVSPHGRAIGKLLILK